jgi:hypothetical protein
MNMHGYFKTVKTKTYVKCQGELEMVWFMLVYTFGESINKAWSVLLSITKTSQISDE